MKRKRFCIFTFLGLVRQISGAYDVHSTLNLNYSTFYIYMNITYSKRIYMHFAKINILQCNYCTTLFKFRQNVICKNQNTGKNYCPLNCPTGCEICKSSGLLSWPCLGSKHFNTDSESNIII